MTAPQPGPSPVTVARGVWVRLDQHERLRAALLEIRDIATAREGSDRWVRLEAARIAAEALADVSGEGERG